MTPEGRLARAHEELAACATSGDRGRHADAVGAVVEALVCFDDMVGAFECSEELVDGWTARLAGPDPTASRRTLLYLELVEQVYAAVNVELAVFITRGRRADLLAESGRQQESEELLRELVAHADSAPVEVYGGDAHRALALLLAERGEHVEALALLDRAVDRARRAGDGESLAASLSARSDVLDLQGRPDEAQADVDELLGALLTSVEEEVDPQLVQAHRRLADAVAARDDGAFQEATGRIADLVEAGGQPTALALLELVRVRLDALLPEPSEPPDDDGRRQCSRYARAVERLFPWLDDELAGVDLEAPVAGALDVAGAVHAQLGEDDAAARCFEAAGRRWGALSADDLAQDSAQAAADVWLRIAYRSFSDQPAHEAASRRAYELARTTSRGGCLSMAATGLAHALSRRSAYDEAVAVLGPQLAVLLRAINAQSV